jgi:hypothetical protein
MNCYFDRKSDAQTDYDVMPNDSCVLNAFFVSLVIELVRINIILIFENFKFLGSGRGSDPPTGLVAMVIMNTTIGFVLKFYAISPMEPSHESLNFMSCKGAKFVSLLNRFIW